MIECSHRISHRCTNRFALPIYGEMPSAGVCEQCSYRNGYTGLGDVVHAMAKATGIAKAVEKIAGNDCGCAERRAALNAAMPFTDRRTES
jgi:hypothetical protein